MIRAPDALADGVGVDGVVDHPNGLGVAVAPEDVQLRLRHANRQTTDQISSHLVLR